MNNAITTTENQITKEQVQQNVINYFKANDLDSRLTETQKDHFLQVCVLQGLNPLLKEAYAVPFKGKMNIVVAYTEYLKRADSNPNYDGFELESGNDDYSSYVKCIVYRKDRKPMSIKAYLKEYMQKTQYGNGMWELKPMVMLEKVAISRALRMAFPQDFAGMPYTQDEMPQETIEVKHVDVTPGKGVKIEGDKVNVDIKQEATKSLKEDLTEITCEHIYEETKAVVTPFYKNGSEENKAVITEYMKKLEACTKVDFSRKLQNELYDKLK